MARENLGWNRTIDRDMIVEWELSRKREREEEEPCGEAWHTVSIITSPSTRNFVFTAVSLGPQESSPWVYGCDGASMRLESGKTRLVAPGRGKPCQPMLLKLWFKKDGGIRKWASTASKMLETWYLNRYLIKFCLGINQKRRNRNETENGVYSGAKV